MASSSGSSKCHWTHSCRTHRADAVGVDMEGHGSAKGRIVLIGYQDLDLQNLMSSAPTMSRRTRQVCLQQSSVRHWRALKAVKAAFLQGDASEEARQLFARPVPELARAMNLKENEMVQVLKPCYGLVIAPAQWYLCVARTLADWFSPV